MNINTDFIRLCEEYGLDKSHAFHFAILVTFKGDIPGLESYFLDGERSVFPYEKFQEYSIALMEDDIEERTRKLKVPLFGSGRSEVFDLFLDLLKEKNINNFGHLNNQRGFNIFGSDDRKAFQILMNKNDGLDIEKLADVVAEYYRTAEFATKLSGFLLSDNIKMAL